MDLRKISFQGNSQSKILDRESHGSMKRISLKSMTSEFTIPENSTSPAHMKSKKSNFDDDTSMNKAKLKLFKRVNQPFGQMKSLSPNLVGDDEDFDNLDEEGIGFRKAMNLKVANVKNQKFILKAKGKLLGSKKVAPDQQFYDQNFKKFENIDTFINTKGIMQGLNSPMKNSPLRNGISQNEQKVSVYMDYLVVQEKKKLIVAKAETTQSKLDRQEKQAAFFKEYHDMFWSATNENDKTMFENDNLNRQNDYKYILQLETYMAQTHDQEVAEFEQNKELKLQIDLDQIQDLKNSLYSKYHVSLQKQNNNVVEKKKIKDEEQHMKQQAQDFISKSDKILTLIRMASKKIFNKKEQTIQLEHIQNEMEKQVMLAERRKNIRNVMHIKKTYSVPKKQVLSVLVDQPNLETIIEQRSLIAQQLQRPSVLPLISSKQQTVERHSQSVQEVTPHHQSGNDEAIFFHKSSYQHKLRAQLKQIADPEIPQRQKDSINDKQQSRLNTVLSALQSLSKQQKNENVKLVQLSNDQRKYYSKLDQLSKESSINDILSGLLDKMSQNFDKNFYKNVQKSMKKQII